MSFFDDPQGAAIYKLALLGAYTRPWASKVGSRARNGRICYFDGFAGQGFYKSGADGSPATVAAVASLVDGHRELDGYLVEKDADNFALLNDANDRCDWGWRVHRGYASDHVESVIEWAGASPLLSFLDPYGLNISADDIALLMNATRPGSEVILNVSKHGIRRAAGHLTGKPHAARDSFLSSMDAAMGGDWWRPIWEASPGDSAAREIAEVFSMGIASTIDCGMFRVPVHDRLDGPIDYYLVHLTRHTDGQWLFNESASLARERALKWHVDHRGPIEQQLGDPTKDSLAAEIADNLRVAMTGRTSFLLGSDVQAVYGETMGIAREMHVRAAVKLLYDSGEIAETPVGVKRLQRFRISPRPA